LPTNGTSPQYLSFSLVLTLLNHSGAYNRLSPSFRSYLETLTVLHSGKEQAQDALDGNRGGLLKRAPVTHVHPLIRTHPVTGEKALYVNQGFSRKIIGLKIEESDAILKLL
jgi:sulfonate dioxygenase